MNAIQKTFTYVDVLYRLKEITKNRFFLDVYTCSRNDQKNGTIERLVTEAVLLCSYLDQYRKDSKVAFKWLNENGTIFISENQYKSIIEIICNRFICYIVYDLLYLPFVCEVILIV